MNNVFCQMEIKYVAVFCRKLGYNLYKLENASALEMTCANVITTSTKSTYSMNENEALKTILVSIGNKSCFYLIPDPSRYVNKKVVLLPWVYRSMEELGRLESTREAWVVSTAQDFHCVCRRCTWWDLILKVYVCLSFKQEYYDLDKHLYRVDSSGRPNRPTGTDPSVVIRDMTTKNSTYYNRKTGEKIWIRSFPQ